MPRRTCHGTPTLSAVTQRSPRPVRTGQLAALAPGTPKVLQPSRRRPGALQRSQDAVLHPWHRACARPCSRSARPPSGRHAAATGSTQVPEASRTSTSLGCAPAALPPHLSRWLTAPSPLLAKPLTVGRHGLGLCMRTNGLPTQGRQTTSAPLKRLPLPGPHQNGLLLVPRWPAVAVALIPTRWALAHATAFLKCILAVSWCPPPSCVDRSYPSCRAASPLAAFVFVKELANDPKAIAEATSHEGVTTGCQDLGLCTFWPRQAPHPRFFSQRHAPVR
jgi:hypothetical protein